MKIETKFNIKDQVYFAELDLYHPRTQIDPFTINGIKIDENYRIFYLYNYCDRSGDSFIEEIEQKYVFLTYEEALLGSKLLFENMIREEVAGHEQKLNNLKNQLSIVKDMIEKKGQKNETI